MTMGTGNRSIQMLAVDFGASSGRTMLGSFDGSRLALEEVHRFANEPVQLGGTLHWDFLRLFYELKRGIHAHRRQAGQDPASIAVDTWGVDYGLVNGSGELLGNPVHYRDPRNEAAMKELLETAGEEELYRRSGVIPASFNTVFQLYAARERLREAAGAGSGAQLLLTPDLFRYYLSGDRTTEYTIASTTGLLRAGSRSWDNELLAKLGIPDSLLGEVVLPGTAGGLLRAEIADELGTGRFKVIAAASHDTASAVLSLPSQEAGSVYISCGTWSLMGVETNRPVIDGRSLTWGFTNEGAADGGIRLQKNIMGLWLLQECKRQWELEGVSIGYAEMQELAAAESGRISYIDTEDPVFLPPGRMPQRIAEYCRRTGQPVPEGRGALVRCVVESLAMKFRQTLEETEALTGRKAGAVHMVGGGIHNKLLCRLTADICGRTVVAGPAEATAIGNLMMQALAHGEVSGTAEIRQVVRDSFPPDIYSPSGGEGWDAAYAKYREVCGIDESNHTMD